jgi:hypothetical protein
MLKIAETLFLALPEGSALPICRYTSLRLKIVAEAIQGNVALKLQRHGFQGGASKCYVTKSTTESGDIIRRA